MRAQIEFISEMEKNWATKSAGTLIATVSLAIKGI